MDTNPTRRRGPRWPWLVAYLLLMAAIVLALWQTRRSVLSGLDDEAGREQWREWKRQEQARALAKKSPVERRPPTTDEPPAVILLRDHFAAIVAGCLAAGTVLFAFLAIAIRGVLSTGKVAVLAEEESGERGASAP
jgi:hypothetical protein